MIIKIVASTVFGMLITVIFANLISVNEPKLPSLINEDELQISEIKSIIKHFADSDDFSNTTRIKKKLIEICSNSEKNRHLCIENLLKSMNDFSKFHTSKDYHIWRGVVLTLGDLKAVEAIDMLIDCLDCNDDQSGYVIERFPAAYSLEKIGSAAYPKLSKFLEKKDLNFMQRFWATHLLEKQSPN